MASVVLITGADLGDTVANCTKAAQMVAQQVGEITACSEIWRSEAWGFESEAIFANQVLVVECDHSPMELLSVLQSIERSFGRDKPAQPEVDGCGNRVYSSRLMDIDILLYDDVVMESERLTIPHSMLHLREFVLNPLCEVIPDRVHPVLGLSMAELKARLKSGIAV